MGAREAPLEFQDIDTVLDTHARALTNGVPGDQLFQCVGIRGRVGHDTLPAVIARYYDSALGAVPAEPHCPGFYRGGARGIACDSQARCGVYALLQGATVDILPGTGRRLGRIQSERVLGQVQTIGRD